MIYMGGKDESVVKQKVSNRISAIVKNETENLTKIVNDTITNISTSMVSETAASIKQSTTAGNTLTADSLTAMGGGKVNLEQNAMVEAQNKAVIQIITSADSMNELGNKIIADITNKSKQDGAAKQSMDTLAKIGDATKDAGGPEALVASVTGMIGGLGKSLTGGSTSSKSDTEIENEVKTELFNKTVNSTDITNKITTNISNSIKQAAEAKCDMNTSGSNIINVKDILAHGVGSELNVKQSVSIKAFNDCFIKLEIGAKIASSLTNDAKFATTAESDQKAATEQAQKTDTKVGDETIKESAIMTGLTSMVSSVTSMIGTGMIFPIIICVVVLGAAAFFTMSGGSAIPDAGSGPDVTTDAAAPENKYLFIAHGGGNPSMIYLLAGVIAFLIFVYNKSIPLCGALLVIIVLYFVYKSNPDLLNMEI